MINLSTGLRVAMLDSYGLRAMLNKGHILVYSGAQPANADAAPTGTLLGRITQDGVTPVPGQDAGGLLLSPTTIGSPRTAHQGNWVLKGVADGIPGWWRFVWNLADPGTNSPYYPRMDGSVGDNLLNLPPTLSESTVIPAVHFELFYVAQL